MELETNMITKDGKKMMYLISIGVKKNCKDYDAIWTELKRRMNAVSIPIICVDWPIYDDNSDDDYDYSESLFYAQSFEIGMGFVTGVMKNHKIRSNLEFCIFLNGGPYGNDPKKYYGEDIIDAAKKYIAKYHPDEVW